jgi:Transglutaminase-like superfamily
MDLLALIRSKALSAGRLTGSQWWLVAQSWFLLIIVDLSLRLVPYPRIRSFIEGPSRTLNELSSEETNRLFRIVSTSTDIAARNHVASYTCLRRALVIAFLLRRKGVPAAVRFGLKRDSASFEPHAWVEYFGQPAGDINRLRNGYVTLENWGASL